MHTQMPYTSKLEFSKMIAVLEGAGFTCEKGCDYVTAARGGETYYPHSIVSALDLVRGNKDTVH